MLILSLLLSISLCACTTETQAEETELSQTVEELIQKNSTVPQKEDIEIKETYTSEADGEHVIETDGESIIKYALRFPDNEAKRGRKADK